MAGETLVGAGMLDRGKCRSCGAAIRWAKTEANDRPIPLDPHGSPDGTLALVMLDNGMIRARALGPLDVIEVRSRDPRPPLYVSHFATCPNAGHHRKSPR